MRKRKLDDILEEHSFASGANVLKIDTDGHDFEVIAGSAGLLSRNRPAHLFECAAFGNPNYSEDCLSTLKFLKQIGYSHFCSITTLET